MRFNFPVNENARQFIFNINEIPDSIKFDKFISCY